MTGKSPKMAGALALGLPAVEVAAMVLIRLREAVQPSLKRRGSETPPTRALSCSDWGLAPFRYCGFFDRGSGSYRSAHYGFSQNASYASTESHGLAALRDDK